VASGTVSAFQLHPRTRIHCPELNIRNHQEVPGHAQMYVQGVAIIEP
jgi:hypothetical protein